MVIRQIFKSAPMASRLVMRCLYFLILALHNKYQPCKPSGTSSNRHLNDKTASNGLHWHPVTSILFSILTSKTNSWKPGPFCHLKVCLKGFLKTDWAHILRGWIFLRPGFHETIFEAVATFWNSEVAWGHLRMRPIVTLGSYFTWLNIFAPWFSWDHFWGCHNIWPQPQMASASNGLERPRNFKMSRQPQKWSHGNRGAKIFSHVKYELNLWSGTPSNRLLNDKTASNGLKNSLKVMFEANSRICMKKYKFWHP